MLEISVVLRNCKSYNISLVFSKCKSYNQGQCKCYETWQLKSCIIKLVWFLENAKVRKLEWFLENAKVIIRWDKCV